MKVMRAFVLACILVLTTCGGAFAGTNEDVVAVALAYNRIVESGLTDGLADYATHEMQVWRDVCRFWKELESDSSDAENASENSQYRVVITGEIKDNSREAQVKIYKTLNDEVIDVKHVKLAVDENGKWLVSDEKDWLRRDPEQAWASHYFWRTSEYKEPTMSRGNVVISILDIVRYYGNVYMRVDIVNASRKVAELYPGIESYLAVIPRGDGETESSPINYHWASYDVSKSLNGTIKPGTVKEGYLLFRNVDTLAEAEHRALIVPEMNGDRYEIPIIFEWEDDGESYYD